LLLSRAYRLTSSLSNTFAKRFLSVPKSKPSESRRRIRSGDISNANVGWARVVEMEDTDLRTRGQEKKCREQKVHFLQALELSLVFIVIADEIPVDRVAFE